MNKKELLTELQKININITKEQSETIDVFCDYLMEYNEHTNLTAIKDRESIYLKHIYDSLTLSTAINLNELETVLDIGTGPGFPGIVLKFIYPHLKITLLDSNNKKTKFLETVVEKFQLNEITIINARAEDYIQNNREKFDLVTSRAVARLNILLELSIPYVTINGYFIAMKGIKDQVETEEGIATALLLDSKIELILELELPIENSARTLYKIKKESQTSKKYPRRYEQIKKNPLK